MRPLLLAGLAVLATVRVAQGQSPPSNLPPSPSGGYPSRPSVFLGGNNILNQDGSALNDPLPAPPSGQVSDHHAAASESSDRAHPSAQ
jgi:hypothetical protein